MRGEIVRLVFSLCLIGGAFLAGMYAGWRRWGVQPPHDPGVRFTHDQPPSGERPSGEARRNLFAPESDVLDLRTTPAPLGRRTIPGSARSLPRGTIGAHEVIDPHDTVGRLERLGPYE